MESLQNMARLLLCDNFRLSSYILKKFVSFYYMTSSHLHMPHKMTFKSFFSWKVNSTLTLDSSSPFWELLPAVGLCKDAPDWCICSGCKTFPHSGVGKFYIRKRQAVFCNALRNNIHDKLNCPVCLYILVRNVMIWVHIENTIYTIYLHLFY